METFLILAVIIWVIFYFFQFFSGNLRPDDEYFERADLEPNAYIRKENTQTTFLPVNKDDIIYIHEGETYIDANTFNLLNDILKKIFQHGIYVDKENIDFYSAGTDSENSSIEFTINMSNNFYTFFIRKNKTKIIYGDISNVDVYNFNNIDELDKFIIDKILNN